MRRPAAVLAATALALTLAACSPEVDEDRCVPPTPSASGAPHVEADDGEPCVPDGAGGWTEAPDSDGHVKAKSTKATSTTKAKTTQRPRTGSTTSTRRTR